MEGEMAKDMTRGKNAAATLRTATPVQRSEVSREFLRVLSDVKNGRASSTGHKAGGFSRPLRPTSSS